MAELRAHFARTSKIRQWINLNERKQATEVGRRLIEREARQAGVSLKKISDEELLRVASEYGRAKVEDLYADLGYGKYSARQVLAKLTGQSIEGKPEGEGAEPRQDRFHGQADAGHPRSRPFWCWARII